MFAVACGLTGLRVAQILGSEFSSIHFHLFQGIQSNLQQVGLYEQLNTVFILNVD